MWRLHNDLSNDIFDQKTESMIENTRVICDLKSLLSKIKDRGAVAVGFEEASKFVTAARAVTNSISFIEDEDLKKCFRDFVYLLGVTFISKQKKLDRSILKNKELIQKIWGKDINPTFSSVRVILHCICAAAVKVSVESVVESLVSRYEHHFSSSRQPLEEHALNEMVIAENGPLLHHADRILERSMNEYWKVHNSVDGSWHFLRHSHDIRSYTGNASKVVGKLLEEKSKLPFM